MTTKVSPPAINPSLPATGLLDGPPRGTARRQAQRSACRWRRRAAHRLLVGGPPVSAEGAADNQRAGAEQPENESLAHRRGSPGGLVVFDGDYYLLAYLPKHDASDRCPVRTSENYVGAKVGERLFCVVGCMRWIRNRSSSGTRRSHERRGAADRGHSGPSPPQRPSGHVGDGSSLLAQGAPQAARRGRRQGGSRRD